MRFRLVLFFFFSSRRRHTRSLCDWSSDVCSSDLVDGLTGASKVVFSSSLEDPLTWANSTLVRDDAVDAVRAMKEEGSGLLSTIGSLSLCRSLLRGGLVDRFRVVMFPVITGATGSERIYDGYPDVSLDMIDSRTFDGRIQLVEYRPSVVDH